jgi:hypothetical protein
MSYGPGASVVGSTLPRLYTPPLVVGPAGPCGCGCALTDDSSYGFAVAMFADGVLGMPLDPWERFLAIHGGELLPDGRPRFRRLLAIVARQNGKTHLLVVLSLFWLYIECLGLVLGTSSTLTYAKEAWEKAVNVARGIPELAEEIPVKGGVLRNLMQLSLTMERTDPETGRASVSRYLVAAANERGGRSLTVDRYIADELREHDSFAAWNAAYNAMNAVWDAQAWAISNQGTAKSVVLDSLRAEAVSVDGRLRPLDQIDPRFGLFEWSCEPSDDPEDPYALAQSNPNLGRRIDVDVLLSEARAAKRDGGERLTGFRTEVMCIRETVLDPAIDAEAWPECFDPYDLTELPNRPVFCFEVAENGLHATLYAASLLDDGRVAVDLVKEWDGADCTAQLRRDLPILAARTKPRKVGWFPTGPAAAVAAAMKKRRGGIARLAEIRGEVTAACMGYAEQVKTRSIAHSGDPLLTGQQEYTEKSWRGDAWVFTRRGAGQCDAIYAVAGAVHLARTTPVRRRAEPESEDQPE